MDLKQGAKGHPFRWDPKANVFLSQKTKGQLFKFRPWTNWKSGLKSFKTLIQLLGVHLENSRSIKIILFSLFSVNPQIYSDILGLPPHCAQFPLHATSDAMRVLLLLSTHRGGLMANVGSQSWKGCCPYMGVSINEDTPKWMVYKGITYSNDFKWMIWRYPHFRKPPYCHPTILPQIKATTIWSSLVCLSSILGNVQNVFIVQDRCVQFSVCEARSNAVQGFKLAKI